MVQNKGKCMYISFLLKRPNTSIIRCFFVTQTHNYVSPMPAIVKSNLTQAG